MEDQKDFVLMPFGQGESIIIDPVDHEKLTAYSWHKNLDGHIERVAYNDGKKTFILMSHHILSPPKGGAIEHINLNKLDNRKSNLLVLSANEVTRDIIKAREKNSTHHGVSFYAPKCLWRSRIKYHGIQKTLGYFQSEYKCALLYDAVLKMLPRNSLCLNFPRGFAIDGIKPLLCQAIERKFLAEQAENINRLVKEITMKSEASNDVHGGHHRA